MQEVTIIKVLFPLKKQYEGHKTGDLPLAVTVEN
jgi:hypothetical protein